jgi:drug/metabolite transporter (DMT)-like permease
MQRSTVPYLKALFAVVVWGASFIATKVALRDVSPATVVWLRFAMGVVILGGIVAARKQMAMPAMKWDFLNISPPACHVDANLMIL